jgi:hypothetical protein
VSWQMCSVLSTESVMADVFQIIAVVGWEEMRLGGIEQWPDLCR